MELKPCPFCGSEANCDLSGGWAPHVWCTNTECSIYMLDMNGVYLDDVIKKWNTRRRRKKDDARKQD